MNKKSLQDALDQLQDAKGEETEGFSELTPEEADDIAGGNAKPNYGCPVYNTGCGS